MAIALDEMLLEHALRNMPEPIVTTLCPVFSDKHYETEVVEKLIGQYAQITSPCSLLVRSAAELAAHKAVLSGVGFGQYARAMRVSSDFPSLWCGRASRNVLLSLFAHGYPSACAVRSVTHNHTYITVPFAAPDRNGVLLLDPTAAQTNGGWPLVIVEEREGTVWEYRTPLWADGADLYPERILDLARCRRMLTVYRGNTFMELGSGDRRPARAFYEAAFANPVKSVSTANVGEILKNLTARLASGWS